MAAVSHLKNTVVKLCIYWKRSPPSGDIACRNCYEKKYSCKAPYNELSGADMLKLLDTSIIQAAADDEKDRCPRCEFTSIRNVFD